MSAALSPKTGRIFDRNLTISQTTMGGRTTTCWRWADREGITIIDEHVAWGASATDEVPPELEEAVRACITEGSVLIVYSLDVISEDSAVLEQVRKDLGTLPIRFPGEAQEQEDETPHSNEQEAEGS